MQSELSILMMSATNHSGKTSSSVPPEVIMFFASLFANKSVMTSSLAISNS